MVNNCRVSHYNPTLEEIRFTYATNGAVIKNRAWDESVEDATRRLSSQFDNWLAAHDDEVRAVEN